MLSKGFMFWFVLASAMLAGSAPAYAAVVTPENASRHVGNTATVCGVVASAKFDAFSRLRPTFLDFDRSYPNQPFTAVIFGSDRAKFGAPEATLRGKRICIKGVVQLYRGRPEIIVSDPRQLTE